MEIRIVESMVSGFRVRGVVAAEGECQYRIQILTREVGVNAPEKCWPAANGRIFDTQHEAEHSCRQLFKGIRGIRYDGEPEYSRQ